MKISKTLRGALLAMAGAAILASSAKAGTVSYNNDDLYVAFYASAGTGATTDLVIDIGSFVNLTPGVLSLGNLGTDLTNTFGSWTTDTNLYWGVFGAAATNSVGSDSAGTTYASLVNGATVYGNLSLFNKTSVSNAVNSVGTAINGKTTSTNSSAYIQNTTDVNSFASYVGSSGATAFSAFNSPMANFGAGTAAASMDLYRLNTSGSGNASDMGTFSIDNSGNISFAAVPEPSTFAALAAGAAMFGFGMRRRTRATNA